MLSISAGYLSRRQDDKFKEISSSRSWRERKERDSGDEKQSGGLREKASSWRVQGQEKAERADETRVYGETIPAEEKLKSMYKNLKINNNKFTTWLVEKMYPCSEDLPPYITLSSHQSKGE